MTVLRLENWQKFFARYGRGERPGKIHAKWDLMRHLFEIGLFFDKK